LTAGGIAAVLAVDVVVLVVAGEFAEEVVVDDELELEDPHPASAKAIDAAASSVALVGILGFMFLLWAQLRRPVSSGPPWPWGIQTRL